MYCTKKRVYELYPCVDKMALDARRFFFGTDNPQIEMFDGNTFLSDFLWDIESETELMKTDSKIIPEGKRNATLSKYADKIIKRYNDDVGSDDWKLLIEVFK